MSTQTPGAPVAFDEAAVKRKLWRAITLLALFCTVYFSAAVIATAAFADIAGILIFGIPLAIYTGLLVFLVGIIVTRLCLAQDQGG